MTDCEFPRIQLRGSAGFSPASLLILFDEDARTKEIEKEQESHFPDSGSEFLNQNFLTRTKSELLNQNQGSGIVTQRLRFPLLHGYVDRGGRDAVGDNHQTAGACLHTGRHIEISRHNFLAGRDRHGAVVVRLSVENMFG